jgi:hypothetical protein
MKNLYLIIFLFIGIAASAQSPEKMSYQAVIRDANGAILKNQNVTIQFTVIQPSTPGTPVYQEFHRPTTNTNGLVSIYIGTGTVSSGNFGTVDWSSGPYFLQTEIDPTGGFNYVISSTTELVSVPYALHANVADSLIGGVNETDPVFDASLAKGITAIDTAYWNSKLDSSSIQNFVDLTTAQTVAGAKTFSSDLIVNGMTVGKGGGAIASNTANGSGALYSNTTGNQNTATGTQALFLNTTGNRNIATGVVALWHNTTGNRNVAIGTAALYDNTTGRSNIAIGSEALVRNTTGSHNTAIGDSALSFPRNWSYNTAIGSKALYSNSGNYNTAIGFEALYSNSGYYNTAIGSKALYSNSGYYNTANGYYALYSNTTGGANTANGYYALSFNTTGNNNTANGVEALRFNTTGYQNTATGIGALSLNTTGFQNTANGSGALNFNTTGYENTANGSAALLFNTTGNYNTANGTGALQSNTTGNNNTALGHIANVSSGNLSNATAIGNIATVSASNRVRIGNSSVSRIGGQVAWTNLSDGRIKENVQEAVPGLSFISQLRPVTYTLNTRKQDEITMQAMPDSIKEKRMLSDADYLESSSIVRTGFIAQEVEAAAQKVGFDFDGVSTPDNETDLYGIRYAEFVVPLVKAMQEQQEMIDGQQEVIDGQQATIEQQKNDFQKQLQLLLERIEALERE